MENPKYYEISSIFGKFTEIKLRFSFCTRAWKNEFKKIATLHPWGMGGRVGGQQLQSLSYTTPRGGMENGQGALIFNSWGGWEVGRISYNTTDLPMVIREIPVR